MEKYYIVSIDTNGSGADFITQNISERDKKCHEYWQYLLDNKVAGTITVREDLVPYDRWKIIRKNPDCYFDTVDWDKTKTIFAKEYHPRMMKSKADLERQIQRIHAAHAGHRLYNKALNKVIFYNHNMSESVENQEYWRKWMTLNRDPEKKEQADAILDKTQNIPYHRNLYTAKNESRVG